MTSFMVNFPLLTEKSWIDIFHEYYFWFISDMWCRCGWTSGSLKHAVVSKYNTFIVLLVHYVKDSKETKRPKNWQKWDQEVCGITKAVANDSLKQWLNSKIEERWTKYSTRKLYGLLVRPDLKLSKFTT